MSTQNHELNESGSRKPSLGRRRNRDLKSIFQTETRPNIRNKHGSTEGQNNTHRKRPVQRRQWKSNQAL